MKRKPRHKPTYSLVHEMMASPTEPMSVERRTFQLTRMFEGLASIETSPSPTTDDWRVCSDVVNIMETLVVEMKVCEDQDGLLMDAVTALAMAGRRSLDGKGIRLDAPGIKAVRSILTDYASLLEVLPERTVTRAHRLTEKRIRAILDGRKAPHDIEIMSL